MEKGLIQLEDLTIIIPIYIDSEDRLENSKIVLNYINKHLNTNLIVYEVGKKMNLVNTLNKLKNLKIKYLNLNTKEDLFHRTKYLNLMISKVKTKVIANYDIDVLFQQNVYKECTDKIINGSDLVYPYFWGDSQRMVYYSGRDKIKKNLDLNVLKDVDFKIEISRYGHCQFFNTEIYKKYGMENESFISYGPEDQERGHRFQKLGLKVEWNNSLVYHLEHSRGINSSQKNPMIGDNNKLFSKILSMSKEELLKYYNEVDYMKKYK